MRFFGYLMLAALLAAPALATINEVEVIASTVGTSPLDAQQKAIDYAQKRAFFLTLNKFAPERAEEIAKSLTTEQIYSIVRGYELVEDKTYKDHPNNYLAKYKVSVSEPMIRRLIADDGAAQPQEVNPMVIFPVLRDGGEVKLWETDNVWRSIWNGVALEAGEGILVVPFGDPKDVLAINSATILGLGFNELRPFTERYGTGEAVVVLADIDRSQTPPGVAITMRRLGPNVDKSKQLYYETDARSPTPEALFPAAAREAAQQLKEIARTYQGEQLRAIANATRQKLRARFTRLNEWVDIKRRLEALPRVVALEIEQIAIDEASATLLYNTTPEMMREMMSASGLFVTPAADAWQIQVP